MNAAPKKRSRGVKRKPGEGGTTRDAFAFTPSVLTIDYASNCSRACIYATPEVLREHVGDTCPYTLAEIERRLASLIKHKQITPVSAYLTSTGKGVLTDGFLRATAFLYAELVEPTDEVVARIEAFDDEGKLKIKLKAGETLLDKIPDARGKIECTKVTPPKSPEDYLALAERNYAENSERKELTPIDIAFYLHRLCKPLTEGGFGLTRKQVADKAGMSKRTADRHFQLLSLPPQTIAEVHEGKQTMSQVLDSASKKGQGTSRGPRLGISLGTARRRFADSDRSGIPDTITKRELMLLQLVAGAIDVDETDEDVPEDLQELVAWADTKPPKPEKRPRKSAPPKPGESVGN